MPAQFTVAIVGRPNVGKSRLFNRLLGERVSIVHDMPGVTRDTITRDVERDGYTIVDTGGMGLVAGMSDTPEVLVAAVEEQIAFSISAANLILMVVDGFENQMWRLWISLLLVNIVACAAYGTSDMPNWKFITFYLIISISVILFTWYPEYQNFDSEGPITRFIGVTLVGLSSFSVTRWYSLKSQEFQINRLRRVLAILGILTFFISLSVMDPPDTCLLYTSPSPRDS